MPLWLLMIYGIAIFAAALALGVGGAPATLWCTVSAVAATIFVVGLIRRGIRPPVV